MNDTEILTSLQIAMRDSVRWQQPASPRLLGEWADWIDQERRPERRTPPCGLACTCTSPSGRHYGACPYAPVPGDADLRTVAKECAPGFAPCKIDDTIFWMGKDNQMHETIATIHNHGLLDQWTERSYTPVPSSYIGPEYIDQRIADGATVVTQDDWRETYEKIAARVYNEAFDVKLTPIGAGTVTNWHETQRFWRCEHHPSAIDNYFAPKRFGCEHACEKTELRPWDNGTCKPPTSLR
jgi:hypothetical protein